MNTVLSSEIEKRIAETVQRQGEEDAAGKQAALDPLPGAAAAAFLDTGITVGPFLNAEGKRESFVVRPFFDFDFEALKKLEHPLHKMMVDPKTEGETPQAALDYLPRGVAAWELAFLMTTPVKELMPLMFPGGKDKFVDMAARKFSCYQLDCLMAINTAAMKQMQAYWAPVIAYGQGKQPTEGEQSSPPLKSQSGEPLTV